MRIAAGAFLALVAGLAGGAEPPAEVVDAAAELFAEAGVEAGVADALRDGLGPADGGGWIASHDSGGEIVACALADAPQRAEVLAAAECFARTAVRLHIEKVTLDQPGKITALEMGGKNPAIVLDDAPFDQSLYEVLTGAYLTTGQRCTATSRVICQRGIAEKFAERLAAATKKLGLGPQHGDGVFMGPLVDARAADDFDAWQRTAREEGAEELVAGGRHQDPPVAGGAYVRPSVHRVAKVDPESRYQREELFAPDTCIYTVDDLDEAIALAEDTVYGLACSIFSQSEDAYLEVVKRVRAGVINWNRSTVGANSRLPFGGMKASGNGHPAGLFSTLYCTYPVASLEGDKPFDPSSLSPGVDLTP